ETVAGIVEIVGGIVEIVAGIVGIGETGGNPIFDCGTTVCGNTSCGNACGTFTITPFVPNVVTGPNAPVVPKPNPLCWRNGRRCTTCGGWTGGKKIGPGA